MKTTTTDSSRYITAFNRISGLWYVRGKGFVGTADEATLLTLAESCLVRTTFYFVGICVEP
jgi:hypothetical protein